MEKNRTYMDKLMTGKDFREKFDQEYQNLCIAGQIAQVRYCEPRKGEVIPF